MWSSSFLFCSTSAFFYYFILVFFFLYWLWFFIMGRYFGGDAVDCIVFGMCVCGVCLSLWLHQFLYKEKKKEKKKHHHRPGSPVTSAWTVAKFDYVLLASSLCGASSPCPVNLPLPTTASPPSRPSLRDVTLEIPYRAGRPFAQTPRHPLDCRNGASRPPYSAPRCSERATQSLFISQTLPLSSVCFVVDAANTGTIFAEILAAHSSKRSPGCPQRRLLLLEAVINLVRGAASPPPPSSPGAVVLPARGPPRQQGG